MWLQPSESCSPRATKHRCCYCTEHVGLNVLNSWCQVSFHTAGHLPCMSCWWCLLVDVQCCYCYCCRVVPLTWWTSSSGNICCSR
jgi:hypothetical protein